MNKKKLSYKKKYGVGGFLSGALSGAATGSVAGPWGAVAGGLVGGGLGYVAEDEQEKKRKAEEALILQKEQADAKLLGAQSTPSQQPMFYAMGGPMMGQLSEINNGGKHEENINGGVPMGQTASVEQGETKWEDYIFSDRLMMPDSKKTFADESKKIQKKYPKERENDRPTQLAKKKEMERLMASQEAIRETMGMNTNTQMGNGGSIQNTTDSLGRIIYPNEVVSDKAKEYFKNNPSMFYDIAAPQDSLQGAPKQSSSVYGNKKSIKNALNKAIPVNINTVEVLGIPATIKTADLQATPKGEQIIWQKEPGIKGYRQANYQGRTIYKKVEEKAKGGFLDEIPEIDNSGIRTQDIQLQNYIQGNDYSDAIYPDLASIEAESANAVAEQQRLNSIAQQQYNQPITTPSTSTRGFSSLGTPSNQVITPGVQKSVEQVDTTNPISPESSFKEGDTTHWGGEGNNETAPKKFDAGDALTLGAQLLPAMYNIGQGLRKQKPVNLGRMNPRLVDYSSSRKAAEDSFDQQANVLNENIRNNATSSGQALSNRVAFANRAAQDKANLLGQINEKQMNTNQQIRGGADQVNLQIMANEEQINAQNKGISQTAIGMGLAQVGQAAGTINRDRNLKSTEEETIDMLGDGTDFDLVYDPKLGRRKRVYRNTKTKAE